MVNVCREAPGPTVGKGHQLAGLVGAGGRRLTGAALCDRMMWWVCSWRPSLQSHHIGGQGCCEDCFCYSGRFVGFMARSDYTGP